MTITRTWRAVAGAAAVCLAATLGVATTHLSAQAETESEPFPAPVCAQYVEAAQVLRGDTTPTGGPITPKPGPDGKSTPVILVHGWTAHGEHINHNPHFGSSQYSLYVDREADGGRGHLLPKAQVTSSFVGMLQQIPGAAVYMFSYENVNTKWVTDPGIGEKLAKGIECLTNHYGNKAVVVGHSMGGLAARQAMSLPDAHGANVSERVAHLVTFGTPNEGTALFKLAYDAIDASALIPGVNVATGIAKLLLKHCSEQVDKTGNFCIGLGGPPDAMYTEGGQAMLPGTPQIEALPKVPASVPYTAFAGDIKLGGITLFGWKSPRLLDVGDFAVPLDSAIAGAQESKVSTCEYGVAAIFSGGNGIALSDRLKGAHTTHLLLPFDLAREFATPCYHNNLMSEVGLVKAALAVIGNVAAHPVPLAPSTPEETKAPVEPVPGDHPTTEPEPTPAPSAPAADPTSPAPSEAPAAQLDPTASPVPTEPTGETDVS